MKLAFKEAATEQGTRKEFCYFISDGTPASLSVSDVKDAAGVDGVEVATGSIIRDLENKVTYLCNEAGTMFVEQ